MANTKEYKIVINGVQQSIDAVKALEKELFNLEERIKALEAKSVNIKTGSSGGGGSSRASNASSLSEEEKLKKQILQIDAKREAYSKRIYQNYLAAKEILKETENDQKQIAAAERLSANAYSNTMRGLKQELADLKELSQTTDLSSDSFKKMSDRILEITNRLKELEQAQGTFSRDVGHYDKVVQGFGKIKVAVGEVIREYENYKKAIKELKQERFELSQTVGTESKEYKDVDVAVKKLESDYRDLDKSSAFMDNLFDTMESFSALAGIGVGLSQLFGIDDTAFQDTMKKLTSLLLVIKSFEVLAKQWSTEEGLVGKFLKPLSGKIDEWASSVGEKSAKKFVKKMVDTITKESKEAFEKFRKEQDYDTPFDEIVSIAINKGMNVDDFQKSGKSIGRYWDELNDKQKETLYTNMKLTEGVVDGADKIRGKYATLTRVVKLFGKALGSALMLGVGFFAAEILEFVGNFIKSFNTAKIKAEELDQELNAINRTLKTQMDLAASVYMTSNLDNKIKDEKYLKTIYDAQNEAIIKQIEALRARSEVLSNELGNGNLLNLWNFFDATQNLDFTGKKLEYPATVGHGRLEAGFNSFEFFSNDLEIVVKNIDEVEKAWKNCVKAIKNGNDYMTENGSGVVNWINSLFVTVKDTEEVMRGFGNIRLSDFVAEFAEVSEKFKNGKIDAEEYAKQLAYLRKEMNSNEVLNSVIANLDKYIPDEKVRAAVQNIINEIYKLDDAFNMTSVEQVHHWNQVRIDGMKEGSAKIKAQIDENERYEIQQYGHTQEQIDLIRAKYDRQRKDQLKAYYKSQSSLSKEHQKKLNDAEDELMKLRIENMANGYAKQLALLKKEENDRLKKAKENGIKVGEIQAEIRKLYHKKQLELDRQWAYDTEKVYEDLYSTIVTIQRNAMNTEVGTAQQNVNRKKEQDTNEIGYFYANYDNTVRNAKSMYDEILAVEIAASKKQAVIREEQLFKEKQFTDREENLRHERMADEKAVSLVYEELAKHDGEITDEEWKKIHDNMKDSLAQMNGEIVQKFNERTINIKQFFKLIEDEQDAHTANMNAIQKKYDSDVKQSEADATKEQREAVNKKYASIISAISRYEEKIARIRQKAIVRDTEGWGVVNIKKTNENYRQVIEGYKKAIDELVQAKAELKQRLKNKEITPEDYTGRIKEIDDKIRNLKNSLKEVSDASNDTFGEFLRSIEKYVQAIGQGMQQIMSAVWDAQDREFDNEQRQLDKLNEKLEKAMDKNEEILERHKNNVDNIEDELQTARGARREHLIDQLNAEVIAERRAAAEKKKIEKEQEALKKKQDDLDKKRTMAQYQRELTSILVSGALATINAYATKPFVPVGLAMGSLSLGIVAAQYAIAKANPPKFAKGGLLEGPSHAQGGIRAGGVELEGNEYVVNKHTTMQNIDLLEYINSNRKKLNISDLIEFYQGDKPRKAIQGVRTRFADGGSLPTLRTDIDVSGGLEDAFKEYAKTPSVVQVVDIVDKTKQYNNVKVLAGLAE